MLGNFLFCVIYWLQYTVHIKVVACVYSRGDISSSMVALSETGEERGLYLFCLEAHPKVSLGSLKNIKDCICLDYLVWVLFFYVARAWRQRRLLQRSSFDFIFCFLYRGRDNNNIAIILTTSFSKLKYI